MTKQTTNVVIGSLRGLNKTFMIDYGAILKQKLEMCQYDTDAPAQGHPHPRTYFAKNEVEKGP